jgi:hypothetical protein
VLFVVAVVIFGNSSDADFVIILHVSWFTWEYFPSLTSTHGVCVQRCNSKYVVTEVLFVATKYHAIIMFIRGTAHRAHCNPPYL